MNFLNEIKTFASSFSKDYTHVSLTPRKESFYIEHTNTDAFLDKYCDFISRNAEAIGIGEKIFGSSPVIADIDIKFVPTDNSKQSPEGLDGAMDTDPMDMDMRLYDEVDVWAVITIFHELFDDLFKDLDEKYYTCILLEKEPYFSSKGVYKHGFHLHFPFLFLSKEDHTNHVIPYVQEHIDRYFKENGSAMVFAKYDNILSVPWLLYGSRKERLQDAYKVSGVHTKNTIASELSMLPLDTLLGDIEIFTGQGRRIEVTQNTIEYYLPRILSVVPCGRRVLHVPVSIMNSLRVIKMTHVSTTPVEYTEEQYESNFSKARALLAMVSETRADDRGEWMKIGWTIHSICGSSKEALQLWLDFSKRCPSKFNEQECVNAWERMQPGTYSIGTLKWYAAHDNPDEYSKFTFEEHKHSIYASVSGTNYDIALLLFNEYKDFFKCSGGKRWWVFQEHVWSRTDDGVLLYNKISTELVSKFQNAKREIRKEELATIARKQLNPNYTEAEEKGDKKKMDERLKTVDKLIVQLKTTRFKVNVMAECSALFYDATFETKLDTNGTIIAFNNGIYELDTDVFRPGLYTDYISKKLPIDYEEFDDHDPRVHDVHKYLSTIFPDTSLLEYFLTISCTLFRGGNKDKKVYVWSGEKGDNGKSVLDNLFEQMLGPYSVKLPTSLITGKRAQSGSATPELARIGNGVRRVVLQEPGNTDEMNIGILKELSGNDKFYARDLFQKGSEIREIIPMFQPILICNKPPRADSDDNATWNRLRVLPFESTFVKPENLPATYEEQLLEKKFPMDTRFSEKIPNIIRAFAWVLLRRFRETKGVVTFEPHKVKLATDRYRASNDVLASFLREKILKGVDARCTISIGQFYTAFTNWFKDSYHHQKAPPKNDVQDKLMQIWGSPLPGIIWSGVQFRPDEEARFEP
jgi:phage/plasmid-associated DNA primase